MSYKFLYQNAQIKSRESKLLTQQGVQRLLDASDAKEASRALAELGFGTDGENFDVVFKRAEEENVALLKEMNEGGALDAFLIENDYINLKFCSKRTLREQTLKLLPRTDFLKSKRCRPQ